MRIGLAEELHLLVIWMPHYLMSGLVVEADTPLPGLAPLAPGHRPVDVTIAAGPVPDGLDDASHRGVNWDFADGAFLLRVPNLVRVLVRDGTRIVYALARPDAVDGLVFVVATGFGTLLHQRGELVLHASAVERYGRAVAFAAPSGIGKSTLATVLCQRDCRFLADDICLVGADGQLQPDGRQLKLWLEALRGLDMVAAAGAPVRSSFEKYFVAPAQTAAGPAPLDRLYLLADAKQPSDLGIVPLGPLEAVAALRSLVYRPRMVAMMEREIAHFQQVGRLLNRVPVFRAGRPRGWPAFDGFVDELIAHMDTPAADLVG